MTSVVDKYYRKIIQNIDNVRMKFDISSLLVKSEEHDSKIDTNKSNISSNLELLNDNKTNISNKFNENDKKIKLLDEKVSVNNTLIGNNFSSLLPLKSNYIINNMWLFNLDNKDINLIYNIQKFLVYKNKLYIILKLVGLLN